MKLYHGTTDKIARQVMMGLMTILPRGRRAPTHTHLPSSPSHVYLTDTYAIHYAIMAAATHGGDPAVIEIDTDFIDEDAMNADEDAVEQSNRGKDDLPPSLSTEERVLEYRKRLMSNQYDWRDSLRILGTCTYEGSIPLTAITRAAIINPYDHPQLMLGALDASVTILGFRYAGKSHKAMLAWLFDEENIADHLKPMDYGSDIPDARLRWEFMWPPSNTRKGIKLIC